MKLNSHISIVLETDEETGSESEGGPKLPLFSIPCRKPPETTGMATPPLHTTASVPFQWEEAPGRPRPDRTGGYKSPTARCLDLPPRLLNETKVGTPSPTTVLDGPYTGRAPSSTRSFRFGGSFRSPDVSSKKSSSDKVLHFGSSRWVPHIKGKAGAGCRVEAEAEAEAEAEEDDPFSILEEGGGSSFRCSSEPMPKPKRVKRRGSLLSLSNGKSHIWASIYESIKQAVPWRRRHQKKTGFGYGYDVDDHHHHRHQ